MRLAGHCYSLRNTVAGCVRAAARPGSAATTFARASALGTAINIAASGPTGSGSTPSCAAKARHPHRPIAIPVEAR